VSAAWRKSLRDLTRRRARALFTVLTLALAVAGVGLFAVPDLMNRAMTGEVERTRMADALLPMPPTALTDGDLGALRALPGVADVEPRVDYVTRVWVGERREQALVVGVRDFADQRANLVTVDSGRAPGRGEALADRDNPSRHGLDVAEGEAARLIAVGGERPVTVSGSGRALTTGQDDPSNDWITFYATAETVWDLAGRPGYTTLAVRLAEPGSPEAERVISGIRDELRARTDFTEFSGLPETREPGTYPGQEDFESLASLLVVITFLALLSALVLVANTMTTLIAEQTGQIAAMKAIGARRRDLRWIYVRTALVLGIAAALLGAVLGLLLANAVVSFFASLFFGIDAGFGVSPATVAACVLVGLLGPPLAALPAIRRATRMPLAEALAQSASVEGGGRLDSALRRAGALPRTAQIGLRGVGRRARRSLATVVQVAIAVAILLALLSVGAGVAETTREWFDDNRYDIWLQPAGNRPLQPGAAVFAAATPGVAEVQAWAFNEGVLGGKDVEAWGLSADPLMNTRVEDGRWFTAEEVERAAPVAVLGPTVARSTGHRPGDRVILTTAGGPIEVAVIGRSGNQANNGDAVFLPETTLQRALGPQGGVNSLWVRTESDATEAIDRATTALEDGLARRGDEVAALVNYDAREQQVAANGQITTVITVLGFLIVAISLVALVNTITMSVLERTREIGMLRSIGARARDIRAIFATEGFVLAVAGWVVGVPLGYVLARVLGWAAGEAVGLSIAFVFPVRFVALSLVGTVVLALLVMLGPLRRATRMRPGDAVRTA
jgi:putative ABC transport system permease protein